MQFKSIIIVTLTLLLCACQSAEQMPKTLKVASFNVSMEATNYLPKGVAVGGENLLKERLVDGEFQQIRNVAEIIQRIRPDIILLNEFDYIADPKQGIEAFIKHYLKRSQNGAEPIDYPYYYMAPTNTGVPTEFDLNNDGVKEKHKSDALGFGHFPGHFAMVLLSKYPIDTANIRTFRDFLWSDMPGALRPFYPDTGEPWYTDEEWAQMRLSSKSHWDVPVSVNGKTIHFLASHPTPPVFDGPEDSYGKRNHDEIRFWTDYLSADKGGYIYDDNGVKAPLAQNESFVIVGDLNAALHNSNAIVAGIKSLLDSPRVNGEYVPVSEGGKLNKPGKYAQEHTASWGARADYVLPSVDLEVLDGGVFWPTSQSDLYYLVSERKASSDHRLVWVELRL